MSPEDLPNLSKEIKALFKELRESFPTFKTIVLAPIAYGIAISEKYMNDVSKRQIKAKKLAQKRLFEELQEKIAEEKRSQELSKQLREEERKAEEELKIAQ